MKNLFALFSRTKESHRQFMPILQEYFAYTAKAKNLRDSTLEKHGYYFDNLNNFFRENGMAQITIDKIRIRHMEQFRQWIIEKKKCTLGHASRHIEHCQSAFEFAILMEYYDKNPISPIECQRDRLDEPVSLSDAEIKRLMAANFTTASWQLATDLFLFQCFTGLSYMDLWLYHLEAVKTREGTFYCITSKTGRGKNNQPYFAEYNQYAQAIHERYNGKFPHISNQAYNRIIKKIAFSLNIQKDLSTHNARKTYATLSWIQGKSLETIAAELGNSPEVTRRRYITPGKERVIEEARRLKDVPLLRKI